VEDDPIVEIARERYHFEQNRGERINNRLSVSIAILIPLLGAIGYYLLSLPIEAFLSETPVMRISFMVFAIAFLGFLVCAFAAIATISRVFTGFKYGYMPTPAQIFDYEKRLRKYYQEAHNTTDGIADSRTKQDIEQFLVVTYARLSEENNRSNVKKTHLLARANQTIAIAVLFFIISTVPYAVMHHYNRISSYKSNQESTEGE
jgi:hypothetical protein